MEATAKTSTRTMAALACAGAWMTLVAPSAALGKTIRQEGFVKSDKAATVSLRVKVSGGEPRRIVGFRAENVMGNCDGGAEIRVGLLRALVPIKVRRSSEFKVRLANDKGEIIRISGKVKKRGRAVTGNLKTSDFSDAGEVCRVPKQKFSTSKS